ncbi:MAG TPA: hypothetical protein P5514_07295 [Bacteroidales bacterium]|nr:hypothetical protein [Bacteroidales bacterium]HRX96734.1 hypothetical protein [Bacteroidales bacterium]
MQLKHILISIFFLVFSITLVAQDDKQADYASVIKQADDYFNAGDYINAKTSYQYATRLKPADDYAKTQLQKTIDKLRERMMVMEQYSAVIAEADDFFRKAEYEKARSKYQEAAKIVPSEGYPAEKIKQIEEKEGAVRKKQVAYDDAVYRATKFEKYNRFDEAIAEYEKALAVFPDKQEAKDAIEALKVKKADFTKTVSEYDNIVANADRLFALKYYENARSEYAKAAEARPDEDYPEAKIKEIDNLLIKKTEYDALIDKGDELYVNKSLQQAKENYQSALKIYPAESYPKNMIEKINNSLQEQVGKDELYAQSIAQADNFLASKDYTNALAEYENASSLKPNETYPKTRIKEVQGIVDQQLADEQTYTIAVKNGDAYLSAQNYGAAKAEFEKALAIKPDADYPNEKLTLINKNLQDQEAVMDSYNESIARAEAFLNNKEYDKALAEYKNALVIIPGDAAATAKIEEIKKIKQEQKDLDFEYSQLLTEADGLMTSGDYAGAREKYTAAKKLKPSETYPANKLAEIDQKLSDQQELNNAYNKAIAAGDLFFNKGELDQALLEYEKANQLKPSETYAQEKIAAINLQLSEKNKEIEEYNGILRKADNMFGLQQYEEAKKLYLKASYMKPKDAYPKTKLDEIDVILNEAAALEQEFNKLVAAGDRMMEDGDYAKASERYNQALVLIPGSLHPTEKLKEIDNIEAANERTNNRAYNDIIADADAFFNQKDYEAARQKYTEALKLKPNATYPAARLTEITQLNEDISKLQEEYMRIIAEADRLFTSKEYDDAKRKYMQAAEVLPDETHPRDRLEEINLINRAERQNAQQEYDKAIADADKFLAAAVYDQALTSYRKAQKLLPDEVYPEQMIERIMNILNNNAMRKIHNGSLIVANNETKKFTFNAVDAVDRKTSVLLIKVRNAGDSDFKVIMNYGRGGAKKGGVILPMASGSEVQEFIVPLGKQYTWSSDANDYISFSPQGGDIEILKVEISKGE